MKRLTAITVFALAAALFAPPSTLLHAAQAGPKSKSNAGITMPVTGAGSAAQFAGTFTLNRFAATDTGIVAVGLITGTLVDALGTATTVVRNVAIPVQIAGGSAPAAPAAAQIGALAICDVLHLELGPLDLDLLGLVVHLDRVVLDIDAVSAPGNLLGNLLCAVLGLLDNPSGLADLLNEILSIIS